MSRCDAAVIDVGSNSVRLVLYRVEGRAVWPVFNEKVSAGLGRDLGATGKLSPAGAEAALLALRRFRALIDANQPARVFAAATAAVREADDGPAFRQRVRAETGLDLRIVSGEDEARYAALGVLDGAPASRGVVGDLGGASLELVRLTPGGPGRGVSLPLGPFAFSGRFDAARARATADRLLAPLKEEYAAGVLNTVGGAWRNLALLQMRMSGYPLEVLHQYEISRADALEATGFISRQSRGSLERIDGISRKRLESLPHAAVVLEAVIAALGVETVVVSAFGLREGLLFEAMDPITRARDPLVAGCAALVAGRRSSAEELGPALEAWLLPAFSTLPPMFGPRERSLIAASCRLADLGAQLHPDHRADLVFRQVLRAPIPGMNHAERAFLACVAFSRYTASGVRPEAEVVGRLLPPERVQRAQALGAALRLACDLSGRSPELLAHAQLEFTEETVRLRTDAAWRATLLGEQALKRAATLATQLGRRLDVRPGADVRRAPSPALR